MVIILNKHFDDIWGKLSMQIKNYLRKRISNRDDVEDILQMLKIYYRRFI